MIILFKQHKHNSQITTQNPIKWTKSHNKYCTHKHKIRKSISVVSQHHKKILSHPTFFSFLFCNSTLNKPWPNNLIKHIKSQTLYRIHNMKIWVRDYLSIDSSLYLDFTVPDTVCSLEGGRQKLSLVSFSYNVVSFAILVMFQQGARARLCLRLYIYLFWVFIVETRKNNHLFDFGGTCTLYSQTINRLISLSSSVKGGGFDRKRRGGFERHFRKKCILDRSWKNNMGNQTHTVLVFFLLRKYACVS